jgi:hypothetical protein
MLQVVYFFQACTSRRGNQHRFGNLVCLRTLLLLLLQVLQLNAQLLQQLDSL